MMTMPNQNFFFCVTNKYPSISSVLTRYMCISTWFKNRYLDSWFYKRYQTKHLIINTYIHSWIVSLLPNLSNWFWMKIAKQPLSSLNSSQTNGDNVDVDEESNMTMIIRSSWPGHGPPPQTLDILKVFLKLTLIWCPAREVVQLPKHWIFSNLTFPIVHWVSMHPFPSLTFSHTPSRFLLFCDQIPVKNSLICFNSEISPQPSDPFSWWN